MHITLGRGTRGQSCKFSSPGREASITSTRQTIRARRRSKINTPRGEPSSTAGLFPAQLTAGNGPSHHFAWAQQSGRAQVKADIKWQPRPAGSVENDPDQSLAPLAVNLRNPGPAPRLIARQPLLSARQ